MAEPAPKHDTKLQIHGDLVSFMTYVPDQEGSKEPAMVIAPRYTRFHGRKCYCIPLSAAYKYWPESMEDKMYYMKKTFTIAALLGFEGDVATQESTAKRIGAVIEARLQDLLEMAEYAVVEHTRDKPQRDQIGEVSVMAEGEEINRLPMLQDIAEYDIEPVKTLH